MKTINNVRAAKVIRVVNGNTLDMEIDLGLGVVVTRRVDLARINPLEQFSDKGDKAKLWMRNCFIGEVPHAIIQFSRHPEEPDRVIAEVWDDLDRNISDYLIQNNMGELDENLTVNVLG